MQSCPGSESIQRWWLRSPTPGGLILPWPVQYALCTTRGLANTEHAANTTAFVALSLLQTRDIPHLAAPYLAGTNPLNSSQYAAELEYTYELGSINSTSRTPYQTDTAKFWLGAAQFATSLGECLERPSSVLLLIRVTEVTAVWLVATACS